MVRRSATALVGLPVVVGAVWLGSPWLTVLLVAASLAGTWEFHRMLAPAGYRLLLAFSLMWAVALVIGSQFTSTWEGTSLPLVTYAILGGGLVLVVVWLAWPGTPGSLVHRALLAAGPVYVGFLLGHALALREFGNGGDVGRDWAMFALLTTFATDTGAYLVGRFIGRHRMAPSISPGKTWEGATGGFATVMAAGAVLAALLGLPMGATLGLSVGVAVVGQVGDLAESRLKRFAGAKDSGSLLPGHGGVLDRLDSIVFVMPLVYYLVALVVER